ncbi:hypothetical protein [Paenisporosarcina indica]|uniref:hypothetical protein n=1 Tax=Paenisporosarcina indica TaxID=650093 RepID=UPI00094FCE61|nr:hypothetical protein [Paenisporosarcina indica]
MGRTMLLFLDPKMRQKQVEGTFLLVNNLVIAADEINEYCNDCFELLSYDEEYDACYCKPCNSWREAACQDPSCEYCDLRPKRPLR